MMSESVDREIYSFLWHFNLRDRVKVKDVKPILDRANDLCMKHGITPIQIEDKSERQ